MSHELDFTAGRAAIAFVGDAPWHGLGARLEPEADRDTWLRAAGLDWRVVRSRVRFGDGEHARVWNDKHVLFRSDTKDPLSVVSSDYNIVQPSEIVDFFAVTAAENGMTLETAGALFGGRRFWALARLPLGFTLAGGKDPVKGYCLLTTSCDGSLATTADITSVRVVCNNTLSLAVGKLSKAAVKVRHSSKFNAQKVALDMGLIEENFDQFRADCEALARKRISFAAACEALVTALGDAKKFRDDAKLGAKAALKNQPNHRAMSKIFDLFSGDARGAELVSASETAWGLLNATTEYFDWQAGRSQDARLASAWSGPNADRKAKIWDALMAV